MTELSSHSAMIYDHVNLLSTNMHNGRINATRDEQINCKTGRIMLTGNICYTRMLNMFFKKDLPTTYLLENSRI